MGPLPCALRSRPSLRILPFVAGKVFRLRERILQSGNVMVGMTWHEKCTGPAGTAAAPGRPGRAGRRQSGPGARRRPPRADARPASPRRSRIRGGAGRPSPCRIRLAVVSSFSRVALAFAAPSCRPPLLSCRSCSRVVASRLCFCWVFSSSRSAAPMKPVPRSVFRQISALPLDIVRDFQDQNAPRARMYDGF